MAQNKMTPSSSHFLSLCNLIIDEKWMLVRFKMEKLPPLTNELSLLSQLFTHNADHLTIAAAVTFLRKTPNLLLPSVFHGGPDSSPLRLSYNAVHASPTTSNARTLLLLGSIVGLWRLFDFPAPLSWAFATHGVDAGKHLFSFYAELLEKIQGESSIATPQSKKRPSSAELPSRAVSRLPFSPSFRLAKSRGTAAHHHQPAPAVNKAVSLSLPTEDNLDRALAHFRTVVVRRSLLSALSTRRVQRGGRDGDGIGWRGLVERVCMQKKLEKVVIGFVGGHCEDRLADIGRMQDVILRLRSNISLLSPLISSPLLSPLNLSPTFLSEGAAPKTSPIVGGERDCNRNAGRRISEI